MLFRSLRTAHVISGGFPCQPFSVAGKRRGRADDCYLWPEMLRVIQELRPAWVVGENVDGIINLALDTVLADLEGIGYATQAFVIPACAVDAPHRRDRVAIVAHADRAQRDGRIPDAVQTGRSGSSNCGADVSDTDRTGCEECNATTLSDQSRSSAGLSDAAWRVGGEWPAEPGVGRVAHGISHRVDRLRCLGNAVVPQQFYPIFKAIADIERSLT